MSAINAERVQSLQTLASAYPAEWGGKPSIDWKRIYSENPREYQQLLKQFGGVNARSSLKAYASWCRKQGHIHLGTNGASPAPGGKRQFSPSTRRKISAAMRARWAAANGNVHAHQDEAHVAVPAAVKPLSNCPYCGESLVGVAAVLGLLRTLKDSGLTPGQALRQLGQQLIESAA